MSTIAGLGVSDIDGLALAVRDLESRRLITEAIIAYRGGALRSAIVSTWIAVAYDMISKARELASQGDARAVNFTRRLEAAIANKNLETLQKIERELLNLSVEELEIISQYEGVNLKRLQEDRHRCAHPAFVNDQDIFQPSPEMVRTHIVHALQHLLTQAPLQGRSAIKRFESDLQGLSFPQSPNEISTFVRMRYLERAREGFIKNLITLIISAPFGEDCAKYEQRFDILASILDAILTHKPEIYESNVPLYIQRKISSVNDNLLLNVCFFISRNHNIWNWISESDRIRIINLLKNQRTEILILKGAFEIYGLSQIEDILKKRLERSELDEQLQIISDHPNQRSIDFSKTLLRKSGSYRESEKIMHRGIIELSGFYNSNDIDLILKISSENSQIHDATKIPTLLLRLYNLTIKRIPETKEKWENFAREQILRPDVSPILANFCHQVLDNPT